MRAALISIMLMLSACNGEARSLERQYAMLEAEDRDDEEKCAVADKAAAAWLEAEDRDKWKEWRMKADADCFAARISRTNMIR